MLPLALGVGETQVDPLDVIFLNPRDDILGLRSHRLCFLLAMKSRWFGVVDWLAAVRPKAHPRCVRRCGCRSEEHTSELQSLMRISYAVFCLKKKKHKYE